MRSVLLCLLLTATVAAKPWKPHPIHIIPGVPLKPDDIKPYVPPKLADEPPLEPSDVKVVEVTAPEAVIEIRPWLSPMVGNAIKGARLPVKGVVKASKSGCAARLWYALEPFGYLCGHEGKPSSEPATTESVLKVREGSRLPFQYVMALVPEGEKIPMWATVDDLKNGAEPERQLERGDTVAIDKPLVWEGQADVATLPGNRFLVSWGVRSVKESVDDVCERLPQGARVLDVQLRDPYFHGDTCLDAMTTAGGHTFLLAFGGALVNRTLPDLRAFLGDKIEVISVEEEDALGYACNALCVGGTVLMPTGLSTGLRGNLARRGFVIEELELPELFGKGGGGPRCLVNELRGFVLTPDAPDYVSQRDALHHLADTYPETATPGSA